MKKTLVSKLGISRFVALLFFGGSRFLMADVAEGFPYGRQTIVSSGRIHLHEYNPRTGKPYPDQQAHSAFVATISGGAWRICITNLDWPQWHAEFVCDGTNSYTILPFATALSAPMAGFGNTNPPSTGSDFVTIEPSPRFIQRRTDNYGVYSVWLTYGLSPLWAKPNAHGVVEMPLSAGRQNPGAHGYKWEIDRSPDGRFARSCRIVREQALDIGDDEELRRMELDYPQSAAQMKEYRGLLVDRKATASGYVKYRYSCTDWYRTNDLVVPAASRTEVSLGPWDGEKPWRIVDLKTTTITVANGIQNLLPKVERPVQVEDYRYKRSNETRIFKYAEYLLRPGESWKAGNDPALLRQAEEWLQNGPTFDEFKRAR